MTRRSRSKASKRAASVAYGHVGKRGEGKQPRLSDVELTAVICWLRWESGVARSNRDFWATALKATRNQQTIASHRYWSDAMHALSTALGRAVQALSAGVEAETLPRATLDSVDVLLRN